MYYDILQQLYAYYQKNKLQWLSYIQKSGMEISRHVITKQIL
jgi:hypothetical protein